MFDKPKGGRILGICNGAHQCRIAIGVADVDVCAGVQKQIEHREIATRDGENKQRLSFRGPDVYAFSPKKISLSGGQSGNIEVSWNSIKLGNAALINPRPNARSVR